jgi:hypothetical protein
LRLLVNAAMKICGSLLKVGENRGGYSPFAFSAQVLPFPLNESGCLMSGDVIVKTNKKRSTTMNPKTNSTAKTLAALLLGFCLHHQAARAGEAPVNLGAPPISPCWQGPQ